MSPIYRKPFFLLLVLVGSLFGCNVGAPTHEVIVEVSVAAEMDSAQAVLMRRLGNLGAMNIQPRVDGNRLTMAFSGIVDTSLLAATLTQQGDFFIGPCYTLAEIVNQWNSIYEPIAERVSKGMLPQSSARPPQNPLEACVFPISEPEQAGYDVMMRGCQLCITQPNDTAIITAYLRDSIVRSLLPHDLRLLWMPFFGSHSVEGRTVLSSLMSLRMDSESESVISQKHIKSAAYSVFQETNSRSILMELTEEGVTRWSRFTTDNVGRQIAAVLDNHVLMCPTVNEGLLGPSMEIFGSLYTEKELRQMSALLYGGPLPCAIRMVSYQSLVSE